jgi:hypothetical protein
METWLAFLPESSQSVARQAVGQEPMVTAPIVPSRHYVALVLGQFSNQVKKGMQHACHSLLGHGQKMAQPLEHGPT